MALEEEIQDTQIEAGIDVSRYADVIEDKFGSIATSHFFPKTNPGSPLPVPEIVIKENGAMMIDASNGAIIFDPDSKYSSEAAVLLNQDNQLLGNAIDNMVSYGSAIKFGIKDALERGEEDDQRYNAPAGNLTPDSFVDVQEEGLSIRNLKKDPQDRTIKKAEEERRSTEMAKSGETITGVSIVEPDQTGLPEIEAKFQKRQTVLRKEDEQNFNPERLGLIGQREGETYLGYVARAVDQSRSRLPGDKEKKYTDDINGLDRDQSRRFMSEYKPLMISSDLIILDRVGGDGQPWRGQEKYWVMKRVGSEKDFKWIGKNFDVNESTGQEIDKWVSPNQN